VPSGPVFCGRCDARRSAGPLTTRTSWASGARAVWPCRALGVGQHRSWSRRRGTPPGRRGSRCRRTRSPSVAVESFTLTTGTNLPVQQRLQRLARVESCWRARGRTTSAAPGRRARRARPGARPSGETAPLPHRSGRLHPPDRGGRTGRPALQPSRDRAAETSTPVAAGAADSNLVAHGAHHLVAGDDRRPSLMRSGTTDVTSSPGGGRSGLRGGGSRRGARAARQRTQPIRIPAPTSARRSRRPSCRSTASPRTPPPAQLRRANRPSAARPRVELVAEGTATGPPRTTRTAA